MSMLFSPCRLGPFDLKNPMVSLPFFTSYADEKGLVSEQLLNHYRRIAGSGVGLVVLEAAGLRDPVVRPHCIGAYGAEHLPGLRRLAQVIHDEGAKAVLQICHPGRFAFAPGTLAPSAVPPFGMGELTPREMTLEDMATVAQAFAESALIAREAGFDGVELHGATGYLLSSFTSPRTNHRTDAYGGSLENRIRFPLEVCRTVRAKVGDYPVGYRLMVREYSPGGLALEDGVAFAARVERELNPAYLSVTAGTYECWAMLAEQKQKETEGYMLPEAGAVKKAVPGVAVIAAGVLQTPEVCQKALADGLADAVGFGRVVFADVNWVRKASGQMEGPIRACVHCGNCQRQVSANKPVFCSLWTKEEKAHNLKDVPAERLKKNQAAGH